MTNAVQVNQEPVAWLVKIRGKGGTLLDMRLEFTKPYIRSDLTAEFIPLVAMDEDAMIASRKAGAA